MGIPERTDILAKGGSHAAGRIAELISTNASDRELSAALLRALQKGPDQETLRLAGDLANRILAREKLDAGSSRLLDILLKMMSRADRGAAALRIAERVDGFPEAGLPLRREAARVLLDAGVAEPVSRLIGAPETAEDLILLVRAYAKTGAHQAALAAAERASAARPGNPYVTALLCDAALAAGRPDLVMSAVASLPQGERTPGILLREAEARERVEDLRGATAVLGAVLDKEPMNAPIRRRLIGLLQKAGRERDAVSVYRDGVALTGARLPDRPEDLFRPGAQAGTDMKVPRGRIEWLRHATRASFEPEEVNDVLSLDLGILGWIQARPERIGELASRVRLSGSARDMIMDLHLTGQGVLIAAAHIGLMYGGPLAMIRAGLRFGFVASMPQIDLPGVSEHLISVSGRGRASVAREVIGRVHAGEVVAIAIDGAGAPGYRSCEIFGRPVPISDICARLSARLRAPAFFPRIVPSPDGAINVDLTALPVLMEGEPESDFTRRWLRAWSAEVESFLTEHPTCMRGSGGFWNAIPSKNCEKRNKE